MIARAILIALEAGLLGSIPFGYLLYRYKYGRDIREHGSGNIGATNVMRVAGPMLGGLTLVLDAGKGFFVILLADRLSYQLVNQPYVFMKTGFDVPEHHYGLLALGIVLVIAGHIYTPWLHFRGGKGVATALGVFLPIAPAAVGAVAIVFLLVLALSRYVSLSSIVGAITFPILLWWFYRGAYPPIIVAAAAASSVLILLRHSANIRRLRAGTENRLGAPRTVPSRA